MRALDMTWIISRGNNEASRKIGEIIIKSGGGTSLIKYVFKFAF